MFKNGNNYVLKYTAMHSTGFGLFSKCISVFHMAIAMYTKIYLFAHFQIQFPYATQTIFLLYMAQCCVRSEQERQEWCSIALVLPLRPSQ